MSIEQSPVKSPKQPEPGKKFFTVDEANRALPYVSRVVDDVTRTYGRVIELRQQLDDAFAADETELETAYEHAMERLGELVDELHTVGVELKDFERGLVDFPAIHEDREILLCWCRGEKQVTKWHEVDAGFAGRQPVELLDS